MPTFTIACRECGCKHDTDGNASVAECPECGNVTTASQAIKYSRVSYSFGGGQ